MAEIIDLTRRLRENLLSGGPLQFRRGDWQEGYAMMCAREESRRFEEHRMEALRRPGHAHVAFVPPHVKLHGGFHYTVLGLFGNRASEARMRRVYVLAGLMEAVTAAPSRVLRTDLLRRVYGRIEEEGRDLGVVWRGHVERFLLPLPPALREPGSLFRAVAEAETLKGFFEAVEAETSAQFDILAREYVVYLPARLAGGEAGPRPTF